VTTRARWSRPASGRRAPAAQSGCGAARWSRSSRTFGRRTRRALRAGRSRSRKGLERAIQATETLVTGIDNAGTPDTAEGDEAAQLVGDWADSALSELEDAEDSLDEEADSLEESIEQLTGAARAIASTLTSGVQTITEVARLDPELASALQDSSTCQQLREETG